MKKRSKGCLITLVVLVIVGVVISFALDILATKIVNQQLVQRLTTEASVDEIEISFLRGKVTVKDLIVKEPLEGEKENVITIGRLSVDVSLLSFLSDTIDIENITIKDTYVNVVTPSTNVYNFMAVISNGTNMMNAALEDVDKAATNDIYAIEEEIAKVPKSIFFRKVKVDNLNITYKDYNLCEPPLFISLKNISSNVKNLVLNGKPDNQLHSKINFTCEIVQNNNAGYLGIWAETGHIGTEGKIPAVNAIVAITGLDLENYEQLIPMGIITSLGGSILDLRVDTSVEQDYLLVNATVMTVGGKFDVSVGGTPANPSMGMTDILTALGIRGVMSIANPVVNVGDAGMTAGGAMIKTGGAVVLGAGKAVGNIGKGLFNTATSTAKGEFKDAGSHLFNTGTDSIGDVYGTATNTIGTARSGVVDSGGALINRNSMKKWETGIETRKEVVWLKAPEDLKKMSYPKK